MTSTKTPPHKDFVLNHTSLVNSALVPEVKLHLSTEVLDLWGASEKLVNGESHATGQMPPPYWAFAWPGGQALARYLLDRTHEVAGKTVLDFGAGSGLIAIAAARAGAARVTAADIDAFACAAMALNAGINGVVLDIVADDLIGGARRWDVIVAGDMCYERPLAERLTTWLRAQVGNGTRVLIADPGRHYFPANGVTKLATYQVATTLELEDRETRETSVYEVSA